MRIDEIDLIGELQIKGQTGNTSQFLGLSGSELFWLDPAPSQSGISIYGTNYVWCDSIAGDQVASGTALKNAYASASTFIVSATARGAVLVSPGIYDFGSSPLYLTASFVDIIGVSTDPNSVVLKATGADYTIQIINSNVDTALCNVTLGTASLYAFDNDGNIGCYLRWNNVIATGYMFIDSENNYSYNELNGEFKNIKVHDSLSAFKTLNGINGTYDNIELTNIMSAFDAGSILGTYSNIIQNGTIDSVFVAGSINATFENIKMSNISGLIFYTSNSLNGIFKNIEMGDVASNAFNVSSGSLDGTFENIKIGNVASGVLTVNDNLTGTFSNIEIGTSNNLFYISNSGNISGSFKDIVCNNVVGYGFSNNVGSISGNFENIKLGDAGESYFRANNGIGIAGSISGIFKNIEMGDISKGTFRCGATMSGTFSNIKTGLISGYIFTSDRMSGTYEDIEIVEVNDGVDNGILFYSIGQMNGTFKNITCGTVSGGGFMYSSGPIGSTFSNIKVGNVSGGAFRSDSSINATVTDITVGNSFNNLFYSAATFSGTFENIEVGDVSQNLFASLGNVDLTINNLKAGSVASSVFTGANLKATIKNVDIKEYSGNGFYYQGTSDAYCTIDNLTIGNCNGGTLFYYINGMMYGTFSNIKTNNSGSTFEMIGVYMKNIDLGTCSQIFSSPPTSTLFIDNLNVKLSFGLSDFSSTIRNSRIEMLVPNRSALILIGGDSSIIERCVLLSSGTWSVASTGGSTPLISYTRASGGIQTNITNKLGTALQAKNILQ